MSGIDETHLLPACERCGNEIGFNALETLIRYGNRSFIVYGSLVYKKITNDSPVTMFVVFKRIVGDIDIDVHINRLSDTKCSFIYGFRCKSCDYLYTRRRRKLFYLRLLDVLRIQLRRGNIMMSERSYW